VKGGKSAGKIKKTKQGLLVALWKGTPFPGTSEPHPCAVKNMQTWAGPEFKLQYHGEGG
jgi:hypothetical protein